MSLLLTMNPDPDKHLAYHLKQQSIPITELKVGDIVVTCHTCFHVARIEQGQDTHLGKERTLIWYYDELDNGSGDTVTGSVTILDRNIIQDRKK